MPSLPLLQYPLAFGQWKVRDGTLVCRLPRKTLTITAPGALLDSVFDLCDGRLAWKHVASELGRKWSAGAVKQFLAQLSAEGALVEAGEALACWSELGQVPALYPRAADAEELGRLHEVVHERLLPGRGANTAALAPAVLLQQVLGQRESHRTFADEPLAKHALDAIAWAAHGVTRASADAALGWHRTVASGGNLQSARWFLFALRPLGGDGGAAIAPGLHEVRFHREGGVSFDSVHPRWTDAWRVLLDPRVLRFASALLLPLYEIGLPARKYGNRATLFAHIEAGESLQNAQLMATAVGAAAMVRGDTAAQAVLASLGPVLGGTQDARKHWLVMPALVVGASPTAEQAQAQTVDRMFQFAGGLPPQAAHAQPVGFAFVARGTSELGTSVTGSGRAFDPLLAIRKAEAEAWERLGWATVGACEAGTQSRVAGAMAPDAFVAYSDRQHAAAGFPLQRYSARRKYLWRTGVDVTTGEVVRLPAECIHAFSALPEQARKAACTNSSTSGVAAWTDFEGALCRATLELLERDAFLRVWLARVPPPLVAAATLPSEARRRVHGLEQAGHRVAVAQLPGAGVPVCSVFVQHGMRPFTAITAAADFDAEAALQKALDEAEGRAAHAHAYPAEPLTSPRQVRSIADLNRYWQTPRFTTRSDFFAGASSVHAFTSAAEGDCADWPSLKSLLARQSRRLLAFDLTPPGAALDQGRTALHVVRAFVTGLVPIWFQHGMEPAGLAAFRQAAGSPALPSSAFLHPFT